MSFTEEKNIASNQRASALGQGTRIAQTPPGSRQGNARLPDPIETQSHLVDDELRRCANCGAAMMDRRL